MKSNINKNKKTVGKWYTIDEIIKEVLKDEVFFNTSGGGVTLSGGEILLQGKFITELLKELKENMINTAVETCGYGSTEVFRKMLPYIDTVFFDLKIMDNKKSKEILKGDFQTIKNNFLEAVRNNKVIPRFPYIPRPAGRSVGAHPRNRPGEIPARPTAALHQSPATRRTAARRAVPEP